MPSPTPIVLQDQSGLAQGITGAGSALSQALNYRTQKNQQSAGLDAFQSGIEGAAGDPNAIAMAYKQALNAGADPAQLQVLSQEYQSARKNNAFKTSYDEAISAGGMDTDAGQQAFVMTYGREGGDPFEAMKLFKKDQKGETAFDKKMGEFKADSVISYMQGGDTATKNFSENLDFLESNIENVGRQKAIFGGGAGVLGGGEFGPMQSAEFAEYENRGYLVLDGVIKVFNKAGVLPEKKLKWIKETFAVSPFDTQEQIKGKINSLRSLAKDASSFNDGMGALIEKYGANIPTAEFMKLHQDLSRSMEKYDKMIKSPQDEQVVQKLSAKGYKKGDKATNTETGDKLIFNGTRWMKQK